MMKNYKLIFFLLVLSIKAYAQKQDQIATIPHRLFLENMALRYSIVNNDLTMVAGEKTDMFRDPNVTYNTDTAPKLLFKADDDFVLSTAIEHAFANKWDAGCIVIKSDSLNWVKFCFEKDYTGAHRVVSVVTKNISDDCNSVEINGNKVFYKMAKAGNVVTLYYSTEGTNWFLVRHLQFDTKPGFTVGFLAQAPVGTTCEVKFSQIKYEKRKIKDPYTGE